MLLIIETVGPATVAVALELVAVKTKELVPGVDVQAGAAEKMEDPNSTEYVLHAPVTLQVLAVVKLPASVMLAIFPEFGVNVVVPTTMSLLHDWARADATSDEKQSTIRTPILALIFSIFEHIAMELSFCFADSWPPVGSYQPEQVCAVALAGSCMFDS